MSSLAQIEMLLVFGSVLGLLATGFLVSLGSGGARLSTRQGLRCFLSNFSGLMIRLFGYLAGLVAVQQVVGFPIELVW